MSYLNKKHTRTNNKKNKASVLPFEKKELSKLNAKQVYK